MPTISVVTPAFNAEAYVSQTIASVQAQGLTDWEMAIIDDASTDATSSIIASHAARDQRIRLFRQDNQGPAIARARGVHETTAPIVYFLDADDRVRPGAFERFAQSLAANPQSVAVYGYKVRMTEQGVTIEDPTRRPPYTPRINGDNLPRLMVENHIPTGTIACRRLALEQIELSSHLGFGEDWLVWARLAALGPFVALNGPAVLDHRSHRGNSNTFRTVAATDARMRMVDAIYSDTAILAKYDRDTLGRLRRRCVAAVQRSMGINLLVVGDYVKARHRFTASLRQSPFDPITLALLGVALVRYVPGPLARRIGKVA